MTRLQAFGIAVLTMIIYFVIMVVFGLIHTYAIMYVRENYGNWYSIAYQVVALTVCLCAITLMYYVNFVSYSKEKE
jgi:uncharacterized RDD family membrane protein YckC